MRTPNHQATVIWFLLWYTDTLTLGSLDEKKVAGESSPENLGKDGPKLEGSDINLDEKMRNLQKVLAQIDGKSYKQKEGDSVRKPGSILTRSTDGRGPPDIQSPNDRHEALPSGAKSVDTDLLHDEGSGGGTDSENADVNFWYPHSDDEDAAEGGSGSGDMTDDSGGIHKYGGDSNPRGWKETDGVVPVYPDSRKPDHKISESHPGDRKSGGSEKKRKGAPSSAKLSYSLLTLTLSVYSISWRRI